jgi:molecular chaperone GrpE
MSQEPTAPANEGGAAAPKEAANESVPTPEQRIAELETELAKVKDQALRQLAEVENQRRRAERDKDEARRFAAAPLARDLLQVADNLRRALELVPAEARKADDILDALLVGIEATERELLGAFDKHGIRKMTPKGEKFDYNLHQAMFELENTGQPAGTVVQVMQAGYVLHDRLLRPAMVGVAKGGQPQPSERVDETA